MKKIILGSLVTIMLGSFLAVEKSSADPTIRLSDGTTTIDIVDGAGGDVNSNDGAVTFVGSVGAWNVNVTTGLTFPVLGSSSQPHMDLSSVNISGGGGGTLTISFSEVGYTNPSLGPFNHDIGGTIEDGAGSSLQYQTYLGSGLFDTSTSIANLGPFGPGAFSGSQSVLAGGAGSFSLTQVVTITHPSGPGRSTSFDAELTVPEPASLLLLGLALLGLGFWGRKAFRTQN